MLHELAHNIINWLHANPELGGVITFVTALLESLAIIGVFIPALAIFTAIGALVSSGVLPLYPILLWAFLGAVLGDGSSYLIGYRYREKLPFMWPFNRYQNLFARGKTFFLKHGGKSVFVSRFVGPMRAIMPLIAGMMHMKPRKFFLVNIPSAIIWSPIYMAGGFVLGIAANSLSPHRGQHLVVVIGIVMIVLTLLFLILRWLLAVLHTKLHSQLMRVETLQNVFFDAIHFDHAQQTFLGLWGIVFLILFLIVIILIMNQVGVNYINLHTHDFFTMDRNPLGDKFFTAVTMLGNMTVILLSTAIITVGLLIKKNWQAAKYFLGAILTTVALVYILRIITDSEIVGEHLTNPTFPSQHVVYAVVFYGFLSYLMTARFEKRYHYMALTFSSVMVFIIAVSRLYFGIHWLSDIIGSTLLGLILVLFFIISYRRKPHNEIDLRWFIPIALLTVVAVLGFYGWEHYTALYNSFQPTAIQNNLPVLMPGPVLV